MARAGPKRASKRKRKGDIAAGTPVPASRGVLSRAAFFHFFALVIIVLAMSPATRNLDNIKMALYLALGPAILAAVLVEGMWRRIPVPTVTLLLGWTAWLGVSLVSTLVSEYRWAGFHELAFLWASFGFCLGGFAHGMSARGIRTFLIGMSGLLFAVNVFGFLQFDLFGTGTTGVTILQKMLGADPSQISGDPTALQTLLHTFATRASTSLMSTILNRDFYAAFCLLFLAFPLALALLARRSGLKTFGFVTVGLSLLSILLCQSKGEYIALAVSVLLFGGLMWLAGYRASFGGGYGGAWILGSLLLIATVVLVKFPFIGEQLKSLEHSFRSRLIIYRGAFDIFQAFPVLGGGPGTFKIYFPDFRSPDYFEWGISNVTNFSHNYFLDSVSETGVLGFIALLGLLGVVAFRAARTVFRRHDPLRTIPAAAALACAAGFLVSNLTSVSARWPIGAVGFWTVIGFLSGLSLERRAGEKEDQEALSKPALDENATAATVLRRHPLAVLLLAASALILPVTLFYSVNYWRSQKVFADGYLKAEQYRDYAIRAIYGGQQMSAEQRDYLVAKLKEAAESLEAATQMDSTLMTAYYHLGSTESLLAGLEPGKKEEHLRASLEAFESLSRLAPDYAELPYNLGVVHYQYALNIEQVLSMLPPDSDELRSQLETELEEHQAEALRNFERMGELSNRAEVLLNLGQSYVRVQRPDRALEVYRRGLELYPEDPAFSERLLETGLLLDDVDAVVEAQLALWRLNPLNLDLVLGSRGALTHLLELDRRREFLEVASDLGKRIPVDERLYGFRARAAAKWGEPESLLDEIERYRKLGGRDPAVLNLRD